MADRSPGQILALVQHVDVVHLTYYSLAHLVVRITGCGLTGLRLVSVVLMAAAVAGTVRVGSELGSLRLGVVAAALFLASPTASRYAQEARPYALTALAATMSTWALLVATHRDGRARWAAYAASVVGCGMANAVSLLLLCGHGLFAATQAARGRRSWGAACTAGLVMLSPFLLVAFGQRQQVGWLTRPDGEQLTRIATLDWSDGWLVMALAAAASSLAWALPAVRAGMVLTAGWGWLPPVLLWLVSQVHPLYDDRYLVFCLPGAALALAGVARLPARRRPIPVDRAVTIVALLVLTIGLTASGLPRQAQERSPAGHVETLRTAAAVLTAHATPGDAVLYVPANFRLITVAMPGGGDHLRDVALAESGPASATLIGRECDPGRLRRVILGQSVVWLVSSAAATPTAVGDDRVKLDTLHRSFELDGSWPAGTFRIERYVRDTQAPASDAGGDG